MLKIDFKILQNKQLKEIKDILSPYTKRAYLVGGCVRDGFLGIKSSDFDIEVYDILPEKFEKIMQKIGAKGVGKSYFIYKYKEFDLGLPRTENKTGLKHTDFDVFYCNDTKQASIRRDFTINSIMINIFNGDIIDHNNGINDIKKRVLKHIDNDKFCEDPLRVLRAIQFSARFGFRIDGDTLNLMKTISIKNLSKDRITAELMKFFKAEFLHIGFYYLYELNLLKEIFNLSIKNNEFISFSRKLKQGRKFIKDEQFFIYLLCGYFNLDTKVLLSNLNLSKKFANLQKQKYFHKKIKDIQMLKIATDQPLNKWLGLYTPQRIKQAKKLGFFDNKFDIKIDVDTIIKNGFEKEEIAQEIEKIKQKILIDFLKNR
ncbi:multifunctional tRNA nucleotidyl transferase / 2'3'-cyclic phosphodiesterase / 2' nucleotidase/phosphatase [Campylobacter pinnipediorum subsp. caledonicus]|uniref:CCA tRNA nucleotidyltransferase n=1 Tax=Campylobacter pinnipediorum TaxID=1965231 RepID=UPI0009949AE2|nr:CCA tRNA nucleotidyltransferase [Campylobacter pinnipediorum]AQW86075.1 multifunctional tRNA nucleotidyl transferase / 2'3'-cyclic phosphodiesterase / 2' nucleotidase/phosphatase [Campylobacter pinnipediorum subsp. caledonicus]